MTEVKGRLLKAEFTVTYRDGTVVNLPVDVKAVEIYVGSDLVQAFFGSRGEVIPVSPGVYGVAIDPSLYPLGSWFTSKWFVAHPSEGTEGFFSFDHFMREPPPPEGTPSRAFTVSEVVTFAETRHLVAQEIIRRHTLLLRRFHGKFVAIFLRKTSGDRCPNCYDLLEKRITRSDCQYCYATGFNGGYSDPIFSYVYMVDPARSLSITPLGEMKDQRTDQFWTLPYPLLNPGDFFVRKDGGRWRIETVASNKLEGEEGEQTTRQAGIIREIDVDDVEMQVPCPDLRRPPESFVGFLRGVTRIDAATGIVFSASGAL